MALKTALHASKQLRNCRKCGQPFLPTNAEVVCHSPCQNGTPRARKLHKLLTNINRTPIHHNVFTNLLSHRLYSIEEARSLAHKNIFALLPFPNLAAESDAILKLLSITEAKYNQIYPDLKPYITRLLKQTLDKELRPWKAQPALRAKKPKKPALRARKP